MVEFGTAADERIEREWMHDLFAKELADAASARASNQFANEPTIGDGVIAVRRSGGPPRFLRGELRAHLRIVVHIGGRERLPDRRQAGLVRQAITRRQLFFARLREL